MLIAPLDTFKTNGDGMLLYSINKAEGKIETNLYADFIIHGFECSHNGQVIEEEVCEENMDTLIGAPVLVKYYNEGDKGKDDEGEFYLEDSMKILTNQFLILLNG